MGYSDTPPPPLFPTGELPAGVAAPRIDFEWSDPITITWFWDGTRYRRWRSGSPALWVDRAGNGGQVSADTLVVIIAPVSELAPPEGVLGSPVPVLDTVGSGPAFVFADGVAVRGRWKRETATDQFSLTTPDGAPLPVPPGVPWIHIFPAGRPIRS
jgi:hypothetical protein